MIILQYVVISFYNYDILLGCSDYKLEYNESLLDEIENTSEMCSVPYMVDPNFSTFADQIMEILDLNIASNYVEASINFFTLCESFEVLNN